MNGIGLHSILGLINLILELGLLIMQRVHEDDLTGFLLGKETRLKYKHICIPAKSGDGNIKPKSLEKFYDKDTQLFWEDRFSQSTLDDYKKCIR